MTVYYAMGGGLGHLVRARAIAHTLKLDPAMTVLTSSTYADDPRVSGPMLVRRVPSALERSPQDCRAWMESTLKALRPDTVIIDAFPNGIVGELIGAALPPGTALHHVARLVRADALPAVFRPGGPAFDISYCVEELAAEHLALLRTRSQRLQVLAVQDPSADDLSPTHRTILARHRAFWLVVHSGPAAEVEELIRFAADLRAMEADDVDLFALTRSPVEGIASRTYCYDVFPASPLFPSARRIVSAAGFNVMRQTEPWRDRHLVHPLPRPYDDQYRRAARRAHR
jgi:hypothetical protein